MYFNTISNKILELCIGKGINVKEIRKHFFINYKPNTKINSLYTDNQAFKP